GSTSSTAWSFTTAGTSTGPVNPTAASVTPSSGTGMNQTFQLVFSDGNGAASISGGGARINATDNGVNACWFYYFVSSNSITLSSDDTTTWSSATAGSKGTLQNSQCSLNAAGVTYSSSGNTVTLSVPVTFTTAFAGKKTIYLYGQDSANVGTGYQGLGTW